MKTLGIRVRPGEVTFAVFDGGIRSLLNVEIIKIPKALTTPDALKYVRNNVLDVIREYAIERAGIRVTESSAQSMNVARIEIEGVIQEAFASSCLNKYYVGQIASIARRLGFPRADFKPYVTNERIFAGVDGWADLTQEAREAVLTAIGAEHA